MAQPQAKRKVMGRIDLSHETSSPSSSHASSLPSSRPTSSYGAPRAAISHGIASPPTASTASSPSATVRKTPTGNVRARVDMSTLLGPGAIAMSPPAPSVESQPTLRRLGSAASSTISAGPSSRSAPIASPHPPLASTSRAALSSPGVAAAPPVVRASMQIVMPSTASGEQSPSYITQRKDRRRAGNRSFDASSSSPIASATPLPNTVITPTQYPAARQPQDDRPTLRTHTRAATALASPAKSSTSSVSSRIGADGRPKPIARSRTPSPGPDQRLQAGPLAAPEARLGTAPDTLGRRSSATLAPPYTSPASSPGVSQYAGQSRSFDFPAEPTSANSSSGSSAMPYSPLRSPTGLPGPNPPFASYRPELHIRGLSNNAATQPLRLEESREAWSANQHSNGSALSANTFEPAASSASGSAGFSARFAHMATKDSTNGTPFASLIETGLLSPATEQPLGLTPAQAYEAAEARVRRRLEDLEITNKSLLSINEGLEKTRLKQAKEIRDYKRRLRGEGRYSVLPGAMDGLEGADAAGLDFAPTALSDEDEEDEGEDALRRDEAELDATFSRCNGVLAQMLARGRAALTEIKVEHESLSGGGRVLHPIEMAEMEQLRRKRHAEAVEETPDRSRASDVGHSPALDAQDHYTGRDGTDTSLLTASDQSLLTGNSSPSEAATAIPSHNAEHQDTPVLDSADSSFVSSDGEEGTSDSAEGAPEFVLDPDASID
ncbi:hypothetical protein IE81DRAFT_79677 [Ceraceosorus guamensis]|uniref:Uncharacterized protein n=1 Tax=Ceraceosorus guamensis TaxID=1522189 RepID=A0A316W800_9BASI|nr:hypothetical protein IE81DRAFT_79677 [Ceraceosorus guamensis]PWN45999.1 hypothetical protein IE81DRAFT_79677 [Ceraceosorus guamensis]